MQYGDRPTRLLFSGQDCKRLCGFGDVLKGLDGNTNDKLGDPSTHENELDDESGDEEKTPESSPND